MLHSRAVHAADDRQQAAQKQEAVECRERREGSKGTSPGSQRAFPGLQELRGRWNGTFQAYGGGGGAANVDFNVRGQDWRWGAYVMDQVGKLLLPGSQLPALVTVQKDMCRVGPFMIFAHLRLRCMAHWTQKQL